MKRLLTTGLLAGLVWVAPTEQASALTVAELLQQEETLRAGYMVGALEMLANDASNGPHYSDCIITSMRDKSFIKAFAAKIEQTPEIYAAAAPFIMTMVAHSLCKQFAEPPE